MYSRKFVFLFGEEVYLRDVSNHVTYRVTYWRSGTGLYKMGGIEEKIIEEESKEDI